jgi:hypothetical protein
MENFESLSDEIRSQIKKWELRLLDFSDEVIELRKNSQNRTIKQILGHLIDSTSNNIHRVVHLQYQGSPFLFPNYATFGNNDRWIAIQDYQHEDWGNMVQLWKYMLLHFCHIIKNIDKSKLDNEWIAGQDEVITLRAMVKDFPRHLVLHLTEIDALANVKEEQES